MIPLMIAGAAAGAAGGMLKYAERPADYSSPTMNESRYQVRSPDGYNKAVAQYDARQGFQADYGQANQDRDLANISRAGQQTAGMMYQDMAAGRGPSAAGANFQQGLDASIQAQQAMANSARGGSLAQAAAQRASAAQAGGMLSAATAQRAQIAAQEQQAGLAGMAGMATQQRAQDLQMMGMSAQQAQFQAQMEQANRAQNDQRANAAMQIGAQVGMANQQGGMEYEKRRIGYDQATDEKNRGIAGQYSAANRAGAIFGGMVSGASSMSGMGGMMGGGGGGGGGGEDSGPDYRGKP